MRHAGGTDHVEVDPAVLRAAGNVLFDVTSQVRQVEVDMQADIVPAAHAFDGWRTGRSLGRLAEFWSRELADMTEETSTLGNNTMAAASNYAAADQAAMATMPPDPTYIRGR